MISTTENKLRRGVVNGALVPGVLYLASDSRTFWLADDWGVARPATEQPAIFQSLLEAEIPAAPTAILAAFLQSTLDALIASEAPPLAPRYPQPVDPCTGSCIWVQQTLQIVPNGGRTKTILAGCTPPSPSANPSHTPPPP